MDAKKLFWNLGIKSIMPVTVIILLLFGCAGMTKDQVERPVSTKQLLGSMQATLLEVNNRLGKENAPKIKQAKLILNTTIAKSQQGQMALIPVSAMSSSSQAATGTLTITLIPAPELESNPSSENFTASIDMAEAIVASVKEISQVEQGPVPMKFQQVIAKLSFSVTSTESGGISLKVASVSLGGEQSSSRSGNHTLELVFVPG